MENIVKDSYLNCLIEGVPKVLGTFAEDTGRFMTGDGWAVTNQDVIYPLALLYSTPHPQNVYHRDAKILEYALRGGDALRDFQYPDGRVEFVKVDGSKWGPTYMPWSMYHWLEAYALLKEQLGVDRKQRWEDGLSLAFEGIAKEITNGRVHNIPTWNGMSTYRAGQIFDNEKWRAAGETMIHRSVEAQTEGGYWLEHGGPTTSYNLVYVHAIGLYYEFSKDERVLSALRRGLDFHIRYTYPDGVPVETIDGRVKYRGSVSDSAHAAFSLFPQGRRYVKLLLGEHQQKRFGLSPRIASAYTYYHDGEEKEIPHDRETYDFNDNGQAIVRHRKPWFYCLSAIVTELTESRWGQDRQNFFSLWHEKTGLIIGGGNSKEQPAWSNFVVSSENEIKYIPDSAAVSQDGNTDILHLRYGSRSRKTSGSDCILSAAIGEDNSVTLTARANPNKEIARIENHLILKLIPEEQLKTQKGGNFTLTEASLKLSGEEIGSWLSHNGWRIEIPQEAIFEWPVSPFNPYAKDGKASLSSAMGIVTVVLEGDREQVFRICEIQ